MANPNQHQYDTWPSDDSKKRILARELFAERITSQYSSILIEAASTLATNGATPMASPTAWIAGLTPAEKSQIFEFTREFVELFVFNLLNDFDGTTASHALNDPYFERFKLHIEVRKDGTTEGGKSTLVESIPINDGNDDFFHDEWQEWKDEYCDWENQTYDHIHDIEFGG